MAKPPPPLPLLPAVVPLLLLVLLATTCLASGGGEPEEFQIPRDGKVLELDDGNFEAAVRAVDFLFVDFYAPWCGHCKRLAPQLDEAAPVLAGLSTPIIVAKVNADKYKKLGSKYGVDGFPTLMLFDHGTPTEYTAKDFSEDMMVFYDFDKVPALVSVNPKYHEQSIFYGPFDDGAFLEEFIRNSLLPLTVPINRETVKMLNDDGRKVVLTILEDDESDENFLRLIKVLRSAASANRDLVFGYVGVKQWEEFTDTFDVSKSSELPKMLVWDKKEEYEIVEGSERLEEGDHGSQISRFLKGYRAGRTIKKKVGGYSPTLLGVNAVYILIFLVAVLVVLMYFSGQGEEDQRSRQRAHED
uniref:Thioredoxin domain-containing protein n=1 Tax=Leersia perrieri TaxID=77586 RepID=A0A0D9VGY1_9ORYZ